MKSSDVSSLLPADVLPYKHHTVRGEISLFESGFVRDATYQYWHDDHSAEPVVPSYHAKLQGVSIADIPKARPKKIP